MADIDNDFLSVRSELLSMADPNYKKFVSSFVTSRYELIGVRIPDIRIIAVRIAKDDPAMYLNYKAKELKFEEVMLRGLIIGKMRSDVSSVMEQIASFIPLIDNWSLCDSFCCGLKIVKKNKSLFWDFFRKYSHSDKPFEIRVAIVVYLLYYVDPDHVLSLFEIFDMIGNENHFVKMAIAWAVSVCFIKCPSETKEYLKNNKLDNETFNMALSKICDSRRVKDFDKINLKKMKRSISI